MTAEIEPRRGLRLVEWRPMPGPTLRGFASVELLPIGLVVVDCPVLISHGRIWATLPGKPQLDREHQPIVRAGKLQYVAVLRWRDRAIGDGFSAAVVELVRAQYPGALDARA